jgi:hypothetical protein
MNARGILNEVIFAARSAVNGVVDWALYRDPFGDKPRASAIEYRKLHEEAKSKQFPEIDDLEVMTGFAVDRKWLDNVALHTQITKKRSELVYPHGRVIYSLLRKYIDERTPGFVTVCETGTARGFSALCMAKAIVDAGIDGRIVTFDVLAHLDRHYWNCIDDDDGKKTRAELLAPWSDLLQMITFVHGDTQLMLSRVGLDRINFAFLDAQHVKRAVMHEYSVVAGRQLAGDMIVFDDVSPSYPGVLASVRNIEQDGRYVVSRLGISDVRGYAWAVKR